MVSSKQWDMSALRLAPGLRLGCIRLEQADALTLSEMAVHFNEGDASITLTGENPAPWEEHTFVSIRTFALPAGAVEFQRLVEWFGKKRKTRARLPEGIPFQASTLAVREVSEVWQHEAYPRSGRDFIHIYRTDQRAVLIRLVGHSGTILDNPLLSAIQEHLRLMEDQWVQDFPLTQPRPNLPSEITCEPLSPEVRSEVLQAIRRGAALLGLEPDWQPLRAAEAVHGKLEELRAGKRLAANQRKQMSIDLGALWGEALAVAAKWEWRAVTTNPGRETHAVSSPNGSHAVDPIAHMHYLLENSKTDNNSLLLFNMIRSGHLPEAAESAFSWLS